VAEDVTVSLILTQILLMHVIIIIIIIIQVFQTCKLISDFNLILPCGIHIIYILDINSLHIKLLVEGHWKKVLLSSSIKRFEYL
jgi:hypothetical protein